MRKTSTSLLAVAAISLIAAACSNSGAGGGDLPDTIKIGVSGELSGGAAEGGESILKGVELAVQMQNDEGGIDGRQIEIVVRDTEMDPSRGVSVIREFAADDQILGAIGGYLSTVALAQAPIIGQEQLPYFVATSNVPESVEGGMPWTFGVRMNAFVTAQYARDFVREHFDTDKWAVLYESGGYGQAALEAMTAALEEAGTEPVAAEVFNLDDRDMSSQVARARDAGAEAIYLFGIGASNGYVLREIDRLGWDPIVVGEMGATQTATAEIGGAGADGAYVIQTANFESEQEREVATELLERARDEYGDVPPMPAPTAQSFDSARLLFQAIDDAELTGDIEADRQAVREAVENLSSTVDGAIADWDAPFSADDHDAVTPDEYLMNIWEGDRLLVSPLQ